MIILELIISKCKSQDTNQSLYHLAFEDVYDTVSVSKSLILAIVEFEFSHH